MCFARLHNKQIFFFVFLFTIHVSKFTIFFIAQSILPYLSLFIFSKLISPKINFPQRDPSDAWQETVDLNRSESGSSGFLKAVHQVWCDDCNSAPPNPPAPRLWFGTVWTQRWIAGQPWKNVLYCLCHRMRDGRKSGEEKEMDEEDQKGGSRRWDHSDRDKRDFGPLSHCMLKPAFSCVAILCGWYQSGMWGNCVAVSQSTVVPWDMYFYFYFFPPI